MRVLDLFSGTQSIKPVCDELGWEYYSLDKYEPSTYQEDILDWDYKNIDIKFDIVWASPCCLPYSNLTHSWRGRVVRGELMTAERLEEGMKEGDKLVKKALEIIDYFKPTYWFIENPDNGRLKNREFMKGLPYYITEYCKWGFDYKKPTRIWTNKDWETKRCRGKTCEMLVPTGKYTKRGKVCMTHKRNLGGQKYGGVGKYITGSNKKQTEERHRVPPKLIHSLFTYKI